MEVFHYTVVVLEVVVVVVVAEDDDTSTENMEYKKDGMTKVMLSMASLVVVVVV